MAFSRATFGPNERREGVLDHIEKECVEVREANGESSEWVDLVILSCDGLLRRLWTTMPRRSAEEIAEVAVNIIVGKQGRNECREWPDYRKLPTDKAIEHVK